MSVCPSVRLYVSQGRISILSVLYTTYDIYSQRGGEYAYMKRRPVARASVMQESVRRAPKFKGLQGGRGGRWEREREREDRCTLEGYKIPKQSKKNTQKTAMLFYVVHKIFIGQLFSLRGW